MKMRLFALFLPVVLLMSVANAQHVELTTTDLVTSNTFSCEKASVYGVHLGMSFAEAQEVLNKQSNLRWWIDKGHTTSDNRIYVNEKVGDDEAELLYLIWSEGRERLNKIVLFESMETRLVGKTKKLLSTDAIEPDSEFYRTYVGAAQSEEVTLDVDIIGLKHITYYYPDRYFQLIRKKSSDGLKVAFSLWEK